MKLNIVGTILNYSGYDRHTRELAKALNELGHDVRLDFPKVPQWERNVTDAELNMASKEFTSEHITICIAQPQFWRLALAEKPKKFYGFCVFEGDKIPDYWLEYLLDERVDGILVPSEHTKKAIENTISNLPEGQHVFKTFTIHVIPHGVDLSKYFPVEIDNKTDNFVFIANKGWSKGIKDRGGIQWLLKAFAEEFTKEDKIELRVKINPVYNSQSWNIIEELQKIGIEKKENSPKIMITDMLMNDETLRSFYNEGDVFVSCSMADAFDMPPLEAMACGVPCLVTTINGHCDFVNNENGWIIKNGEQVLNWSGEEEYREINWFKPDIDDIRVCLRYIYNHQETIECKSNISLQDSTYFQWKDSAKKLIEVIKH